MHGYLTGEEYLLFLGALRGVSEEKLPTEVEELLELTELMPARHKVVKEYSGGMARKLAIAGALIGAPPLLLLDESFVGLDPESTWRIRLRLEKHCQNGGSILLSSHILEMLERVCTRIVMLNAGKIVLDDSMDNLKKRFTDEVDLTRIYLDLSGKLALDEDVSNL
jgi:ABC-2 type transport system ATP-binding protein